MTTVLINPPPEDLKCECCGRHVSECHPFTDGKQKLIKDFRESYGSVGAYWVCRLCFSVDTCMFWEIFGLDKATTQPLTEYLDQIETPEHLVMPEQIQVWIVNNRSY